LPSISKLLKSSHGRALGVCLAASGLIAMLSLTTLGQMLENLALDFAYRVNCSWSTPSDLLIIGIDEASFQELRLPWPWPRSLHARLIRRLAQAGARLIVFDIGFGDPSTPQDDQLLADAIRQAQHVILPQTFEITDDPSFFRQILVQPLDPFRQAAQGLGVSMVTPDADSVIRHFRLRLGGQDTLPAAVIRALNPQMSLPPDLSGLIHYVGPPRQIDTVSYYQALDENQPLPEARIRNRIVLIGRMSGVAIIPQGQADAFYTPFFSSTGQLMSGVEVQGNIIHTLLHQNWGREIPRSLRLGLCLGLLFLTYPLFRLPPITGLGILVGLIVLLGGICLFLFCRLNLWIPPVLLWAALTLVYVGNVLSHYLVEVREKRWLRHAFGRYVSPHVVEAIIRNPEQCRLGGELVEVTVLFADLSQFTAISEEMGPEELIGILNEYFAPLTQIILSCQGTLDKYIGDAIMAFWGAPVSTPDHAVKACSAALKMQEEMRVLQSDWQARNLPALWARVGLHSGPVVAGNVGSRERFNYTVLGDTVNLASRLEGINKHYGTKILMSESTYRLVADKFLERELDTVQVKGRVQPVAIYELLGLKQENALPPWLPLFAAGRAAYLGRQWEEAASLFEEVLRLKPDDSPSTLYMRRCHAYLRHPPSPDWQGVHEIRKY
jgi:adenylate cyclase